MSIVYSITEIDKLAGSNKTTYYSSTEKTTISGTKTSNATSTTASSTANKSSGGCYLAVSYGDTYKSIELPAYPDKITDNTSATFPLNSVIGSSSPLAAYVGTGAREISFSMTLHREMADNIENVLQLLRACVYPKYSSSAVIPPVSRFVFGKFGVKGVVTSCNFEWGKPIIDNTYMLCDVSISITGLPTKMVDATELGYSLDPFKNSSMPNYTSTLW